MSKQISAANSDWTPPLLDFSSRFAQGFMDFWATRAELAATAEPAKPAEMTALVNELFSSKEPWELETHAERGDTLDALLPALCAAIPSCACPRLRIIAIEMLESLSPHAPRMLENYIVPFLYQALSDRNTNVAMAAVQATAAALELLPVTSSCVQLFLDHIAPQFMRLCDTLPVSIAAQLPTLLRVAQKLGEYPAVRPTIEHLVKQLMTTAQGEGQYYGKDSLSPGIRPLPTEILRGVKSQVLDALADFVHFLGREGVHNFLLPYLISFMNDPLWEIRAKFCIEMHKVIPTIGRVSTEGIVWPCYEQALLDSELRVVISALHGIQHIVSKRMLEFVSFKRHFRVGTVVDSICPLLLHPNQLIRDAVIRVLDALEAEPVEFFAFLLPKLKPYVVHCKGFDCVSNALWRQPLSKQTYDLLFLRQPAPERPAAKRTAWPDTGSQSTDTTQASLSVPIMEQARKAILQSAPLPEVTAQYEEDFVALDLMRTYLAGVLHAPRKQPRDVKPPEQLPTQRITFVGLNSKCQAIHPFPVLSARTWPRLQPPNGKTDWRVYALRLPYLPRQLGTLTRLDGTPFSLYSEDTASMQQLPSEMMISHLDRDRPLGLAGIAANAMPDDWSDLGPKWQPCQLVCTLHEYQVDGHVTPVVKVDCTDDSRVLVTAGQNGVIKLWNSTMIDKDVALMSVETFTVGQKRLRAMRTVRNAKAIAVGADDTVSLMRIEASNHGSEVSPVADICVGNQVMCLDQFDTHLESLLVYARSDGVVGAWDIRTRAVAWTVDAIPFALGVPHCMAMSMDGFTSYFGTWGGGLCLVDLRFQRYVRHWHVANSIPIMDLRSVPQNTVLAALGTDNQVARFDMDSGATVALYEAGTPMSAVSVPSLLAKAPTPSLGMEGVHGAVRRGARSLWTPKGAEFFFASGGDRVVRYWMLDAGQINQSYALCGRGDISSSTVTSNYLGDVFVARCAMTEEQNMLDMGPGPVQPSTLHWDAVLDMCVLTLNHQILVTAGRDGYVKLWK